VLVACVSENAPTAPSGAARPSVTGGVAGALNTAPTLNLKTTPRGVMRDGVLTIEAFLTDEKPNLPVRFNLCTSDDAEQVIGPGGTQLPNGDSLNWQFNFGDPRKYSIGPGGIPSPDPAFDPAGRFLPDFEHFCRTEHTYEEGTYVATVSLTDKHLEDQGAGAFARTTQRVLIIARRQSGDCVPPALLTEIEDQFDNSGSFPAAPHFSGSAPLTFSLLECESQDISRRVAAMGESDFIEINPTTGVVTWDGEFCRRVMATNSCGSATSNEFVTDDD
jgi:hypothetical protein